MEPINTKSVAPEEPAATIEQETLKTFLESCGRKADRWSRATGRRISEWSRAFMYAVRVGRILIVFRIVVSAVRVIAAKDRENTDWREED